jgi:ABC-2 type transport system permease protein
MAVFRAALLNELEKLYKKKKALVALIISIIVIVSGQLVLLASAPASESGELGV